MKRWLAQQLLGLGVMLLALAIFLLFRGWKPVVILGFGLSFVGLALVLAAKVTPSTEGSAAPEPGNA